MIPALYFLSGFIVLGLILLADHVLSRFDHTPASRRVLAAEAVAAFAVALAAADLIWSGSSLLTRLGAAVLVAIPIHVVAAFVTVELWRHRKQGGFDREIARLVKEWHRWQETVDRLSWEMKDIERQKAELEEQSVQLQARIMALQDQIQAWEQGGPGLRRVALVEQWAAELAGLDVDGLRKKREELAGLIAQAPKEDRGELTARLQMVELAELRRLVAGPGGPAGELNRRLEQLQEARQRADRRLRQIKEELEAWQERKTAFLRKKIPLD